MASGTSSTRLDLEMSRRLKRLVKAKNGDCYVNAIRALSRAPECQYVEGFVIVDGFLLAPHDHAWLELANGTVVDPTPAYCAPGARPCMYFAAHRWDIKDVVRVINDPSCDDEVSFPLAAYYLEDEEAAQKEWGDAIQAAWKHTERLRQPRPDGSLSKAAAAEREFMAYLGLGDDEEDTPRRRAKSSHSPKGGRQRR